MDAISAYAPVINTMSHAITSTTDVLTAVATSELVFLMPHLESIAVTPAKNAENIAATIHITVLALLLFRLYYTPVFFVNGNKFFITDNKIKAAALFLPGIRLPQKQ